MPGFQMFSEFFDFIPTGNSYIKCDIFPNYGPGIIGFSHRTNNNVIKGEISNILSSITENLKILGQSPV